MIKSSINLHNNKLGKDVEKDKTNKPIIEINHKY